MLNITKEKTNIYVPFEEKEEAKLLGAKWDIENKSWYIPINKNIDLFKRWISPKDEKEILNPLDEFQTALEKQGLLIDGSPIMNGKIQRVKVIGDKGAKKSGAYIGYNDGVPSGFIQNHKTGIKENWSLHIKKDYTPKKTKEQLQQQINEQKDREKQRNLLHQKTAKFLKDEYDNAKYSYDRHPYFQKKGLQKNYYLKQDAKGNLLIPLVDITGKHWSSQRIFSNGDKIIGTMDKTQEWLSKKEGCFHVVGAKTIDDIKSNTLVICEGFATAATLYEATKIPIIMGVDVGNLEKVISSIKTKFPSKHIILAPDNDRKAVLEGRENIGLKTAKFLKDEYGVKTKIPKISDIDAKDGMSDFNDIMCKYGLQEVKKQFYMKEKKKIYVSRYRIKKRTPQEK